GPAQGRLRLLGLVDPDHDPPVPGRGGVGARLRGLVNVGAHHRRSTPWRPPWSATAAAERRVPARGALPRSRVKSLAFVLSYLSSLARRRNLRVVVRLVAVLVVLVVVFSTVFHVLMAREGRDFSWATGVYWTLTTMSTLGFGDITFESDAGRIFSLVVLASGALFILVLLPFAFIQFVFTPWMEQREAARPARRAARSHRADTPRRDRGVARPPGEAGQGALRRHRAGPDPGPGPARPGLRRDGRAARRPPHLPGGPGRAGGARRLDPAGH